MILNTWISPALISFIPIFAGWYTTAEHAKHAEEHPNECDFKVNRVYGVISSSISFWIPCTIMLFTYYAIFREANRQEKQLAARQGNAMLMHRHSSAGGTNGTYGKITQSPNNNQKQANKQIQMLIANCVLRIANVHWHRHRNEIYILPVHHFDDLNLIYFWFCTKFIRRIILYVILNRCCCGGPKPHICISSTMQFIFHSNVHQRACDCWFRTTCRTHNAMHGANNAFAIELILRRWWSVSEQLDFFSVSLP